MKEIKRGEIYAVDFGTGFGSEQGGTHPSLILQNDIGNRHSPTTIVAAITGRKTKAALPTHVKIMAKGLKTESTVLLEQIRTIGLPLALAMLLRPKHFPLWYVVQLVKGISVLAILLSLISLIGCKYGVIVENDDIMNAVRLWPEGRGVCLVLLCAGLLLSVGSICAARPVQRVGEYFGIAKK